MRPRALVGYLFRFTSPRYRDFVETARQSKHFPQRFNTAGLGAVYLSRDPDTAAAEALRRYARDARLAGDGNRSDQFDRLAPRSIFVVRVQLRGILALTAQAAFDAWGLTTASLVDEEFARCQEVATLAAQRGAEGVRWSSATGAGESVAIFWDNLQAASHVTIEKEFSVDCRWFDGIADGRPVSDFLPALREFPLYSLDAGSDA